MPGCSQDPAILLKVTADGPVEQYDLYIRDDASGEVIFHSGFNPVTAPGEKTDDSTGIADLTVTPLKIAVKLSKGGKFTLMIVGITGALEMGKPSANGTQLFWATHADIEGAQEIAARLLTVPPGDDQDGDFFPDATAFPSHVAEAQTVYAGRLELLDCNDKTNNPMTATGATIMLSSDQVHPFAPELCGDGYDENCNGDADEACVDEDGDGDPRGSDCDDKDPARHKPNARDPFPDPPNCCGYSLGMAGTADENKSFAGDAVLCPMARCGNQRDESCRGGAEDSPANDTPCYVDDDCDHFSADQDCDDKNPDVHPGALEICGNGRDDSCAGAIDSGCVPCDLDGDGYERDDPAGGCPDASNMHPGVTDCNDNDAGVYPGATTTSGGKESGDASPASRKAAALKGLCRRVYETAVTGLAKIGNGAAAAAGDADCNGAAYEGCPVASCDADGDGYAANTPTCMAMYPLPYDCDDADPKRFPNAPDRCGNNIAENCTTDLPCMNPDADQDGYASDVDCDDNNQNIHPFATELCNGVDDDCDGDKDEGNPDPLGAPLVTSGGVSTCTDDNDGECGKKLGRCVCSPTAPVVMKDAGGNFTHCSGDTGAGARIPHCYGAGQPAKQSCDDVLVKDDDCDGRVDAPDGKNLLVLGMPCGLTLGVCKQGTVTGCVATPSKTWYGSSPPAGRVHWECSPDTIAAALTESCNGFDDDCDGTIPVNETDPDMDKYIACTGCGAMTLAGGFLGCGDCNASVATTYPGAMERCNGVDDDCNAATSDGVGECGAMSKTCCIGNGGVCQDLNNDTNYCGACNVTCAGKLFVNMCQGAACICKNQGAACNARNWCNGANAGGTCELCNTTARCGDACTACVGGNVCRPDGSGCTGCNVDADCDANQPAGTYYCLGGMCNPKKVAGTSCTAPANAENVDNECANASPYCTDGVCCDKPPSMCGGCQTCNANTSGTAGTCANVVAGADPHNTCTANVANCKSANCNGNNSCNTANGTTCSTAAMCVDNATESHTYTYECATGVCDTATQQTGTACGDYKCAGGSCRTTCTSDAHCQSGKPYCRVSTGVCYPKKLAGAVCAANGDCEGGACVQGRCCGDLARPPSCGAGTASTACAAAMLTTYTCTGPGYTACTAPAAVACSNSYICENTIACDNDCDTDTQCAGTTWCKNGGATDTCVARITAAGACDDADCEVTGCTQCAGGVACPTTGPKVCP